MSDLFRKSAIRNSTGLAEYLLDEAHVAVVPGAAFGADRAHPNQLRDRSRYPEGGDLADSSRGRPASACGVGRGRPGPRRPSGIGSPDRPLWTGSQNAAPGPPRCGNHNEIVRTQGEFVKRASALFVLVVFLVSGVALAQAAKAPAEPAKPVASTPVAKAAADPVVMSFSGVEVRQSEFEAAVKALPAEYQGYAAGPGKRAFAEDYLRMRILAAEAEKSGLAGDPKVASQLKLMRENTLASAQFTRLQETVNLSDDEIQKSYDEKKPTLERAKARHILIAFKGSPAAQKDRKELTEDEAKAKAEGIRTKLVAGADFAAIAKAESDDTGSAARGGDLGSFSRGQMVPEFDAAVFEGKVGEISPVVRTQYGFHVIQVQERGPAPLTEVKPQIEQELKQKKLQEKVDAMKDAARVTFDDTYFAPPAPEAAPAAASETEPVTPAPKKE